MSLPDDRTSLVITRPDGTAHRWADDEPDVENVPADLTYGTSMPGGYKGLGCSLMRGLRNVGHEGLLDDVRVLGPGGASRWEGRLQQMPVSTDGGGRVTPQAVGHQAHLEDDPGQEIYIDRDRARWRAMTAERRAGHLSTPINPQDGDANRWGADGYGGFSPLVDLTIDGYEWASTAGRPLVELWYDAAGIPVGQVSGFYTSNVTTDPNWVFNLFTSSADFASYDVLRLTGAGPTPVSWFPPTARPLLGMQLYYGLAPAGTAGTKYSSSMSQVAVLGRHGLTTSGVGLLASDGIADAVRRWAPGLRFTTGPDGTITPTELQIPHMVFPDPTTAAAMVDRWNAFHAWEWAVWENKTFYFSPRGARGRTWRIATADGLDLSLEGETTDRIFTGVVVTYTDFAGRATAVGPPGSGAEITDPQLVTTDPANAAVAHGLKKIGVLQLSQPSDALSAAVKGALWLQLQAEATRRGQANVTGWATDDAGQWRPVSEICAGDALVVTDRPDDPARRIIETSYTHGPRANTLTLDSTAQDFEAILEWLSADLVGVL